VIVSPDSATVEEGETAQLNVVLRDQTGLALSGREVTWTSSDPDVATVDANGLVQALNAGTATIRATSEGRFDEATITVIEPPFVITVSPIPDLRVGRTHQAIVSDGDGQALTGSRVQWESSNSAVASVSADGRVTARLPGEAIITAIVDGQRASTPVRVRGWWSRR
jgi:uncharacterized protein YjdB